MSSSKPSGGPDGKAVSKRLQQELMQLMVRARRDCAPRVLRPACTARHCALTPPPSQMAKNKDATAFPDGDNLFEWVGSVTGSVGTAYEGCTYRLALKFGPEYPFKAPTITFTTPVRVGGARVVRGTLGD